VVTHNPEGSFGNQASPEEDTIFDGGVSSGVALCLSTALKAEITQEVFRSCRSSAESLDILDVHRRSYIIASDNDPELEVLMQLHNKLFDIFGGFASVDNPVELASPLVFSLAIVCHDGPRPRA
jgi:hypothetical protein